MKNRTISKQKGNRKCTKLSDLKAKYKAKSSQSNSNYESSLPNVNNSPDNNMPPQVNISPEVNTPSSNNIENNQVNINTEESTEDIPSPSFERNYSRLKPLKVPGFDRDKAKFEDFWLLFASLDSGMDLLGGGGTGGCTPGQGECYFS